MAHYSNDMRIESMEVDMVGYKPEDDSAHIYFHRIVRVEGKETVYIKQGLTLPLELLNSATELLNQLASEMNLAGKTELELQYPYEFEKVS